MDRLTRFPNIFDSTPSQPKTEKKIKLSLNSCIPTVNDLVISWGILLSRFTENEQPVFLLNDQPVCVDVIAQSYQSLNLKFIPNEGQVGFTAIVIVDDDHKDDTQNALFQPGLRYAGGNCALALYLNLTTGLGSLESDSSIEFLEQVGFQFNRILRRHTQGHDILISEAPAAEPRLSIVNPHPSVLAGPTRLDELVSYAGQLSDTATEFLNSDGTLQKLSYSDLALRTAALSTRILCCLSDEGSKESSQVVIPTFLPQCPDLYVAWLGILKAGATFCPLSLDSPPERTKFILQDISATVLVTNRASVHALPDGLRIPVLLTDDSKYEHAEGSTSWAKRPNSLKTHLAYVMYTSGSTGLPKGVEVSHYAVTQSLLAHERVIPPFSRFLQFAAPTFDVSVFEVFFTFFRGATVVGCDRNKMLRDLPQIITSLKVDAAELTPTVASQLLRRRNDTPSLKLLLTIGEMLTRRVVDEFGSYPPDDGILHAMYGPTEAAIHCTAAPTLLARSRVNQIGRPFDTVSTFIVSLNAPHHQNWIGNFDDWIQPVGHIGELVIGGPQLAEGYINRPQETSEAFIETSMYGRLYRTGDKARLLPDGTLECLGRISTGQIKLRGQRIELGEIESVAGKATGVRSAIVALVNGALVLFAQVDSQEQTPTSLRQLCSRWLPRFMVPGGYVLVNSFPYLPSGKVDRKALTTKYLEESKTCISAYNNGGIVSTLERQVLLTICETLKTDLKDTSSLAAAGLDSLSGIRLASELRKIGVNLDVGSLLMADSVRQLCQLAERSPIPRSLQLTDIIYCDQQAAIQKVALEALTSSGLSPSVETFKTCSHIQIGMLVETVRNPSAYCNWIKLRFPQGLSLADIKQAITVVAGQHDILRSGFLYLGLDDFPFCRFTMSSLREGIVKETDSFEYQLQAQVDKKVLFPLRIQLNQSEDGIYALVHIHHAIYDGWSWDFILDDLQSALSQSPLRVRPSYDRVVQYYMAFDQSELAKESRDYWASRLYECRSSLLWPNFNDRIQSQFSTGTAEHNLNVLPSQLDGVCQKLHVSRQSLFQAAFAYLLGCYLGSSDVVFGTVFSGRTLPIEEIELILGPCSRVLPTRANLESVRTVSDLIVAIHEQNKKSLRYGDLSLKELRGIAGVNASQAWLSGLMIWQETPWTEQNVARVFQEVEAKEFLEFTLTLQFEPRRDGVHAQAIYEQAVISDAQIELLLEQVDEVVNVFVNKPGMPLQDVNSQLSPSLLAVENLNFETQTELPSLGYGVEKIAAHDPGRNAVEFLHSLDPDTGHVVIENLTYSELNSRANQVAHHLKASGVSSGDIVSIILEKGLDLYISILAVIKLGAGYLPIPPSTSNERLQFLLAEAKPTCNITNNDGQKRLLSLDPIPCWDIQDSRLKANPDINISSVENSSNVAYIILTSGSTGEPKGVLISHFNLRSNIAVLKGIYPIGHRAKMLQACSQAFDVSVFEIFFTWNTGMTLCAASKDVPFQDIEQVIRVMEVTHLNLTPTVAALIQPANVPGVRLLVTAGEALSTKVHRDWAGKGLYQGYGASETTNICTVRPNVDRSDYLHNIGRPFRNTSALVLSDARHVSPVLKGAIGEFCFGGDQVGLGYLNRPELTEERFINDPNCGRLYRSGDYGRMLPDGSLVFTGRKDDQVKIRGQRVEFGEINSVLLHQSIVKDCTTLITKGDSNGQELLMTFWTSGFLPEVIEICKEIQPEITEQLFKALQLALPTYMIPTYLIPVTGIPMTITKKIDHIKLRTLFFETPVEDLLKFSVSDSESPVGRVFNKLEENIARITSTAISVPLGSVELNTSLYSLGVDSISAIRISRQLKLAGYGQWDVSAILRHPTVGRLAAMISDEHGYSAPQFTNKGSWIGPDLEQQIRSEMEAEGNRVASIWPCTALQQAMLSREGSGDAYFNHFVFDIHANTQKLNEAWEAMMNRHEILRTLFVPTFDHQHVYVQVVLEDTLLPWARETADSGTLLEKIKVRKEQFVEKFCCGNVLPYSLTLYEYNHDCFQKTLLLSIHHAAHDGEALAILFKEIELTISGEALPKVEQFHAFIGYSISQPQEEVDTFWERTLNGLCPRVIYPQREVKRKLDGPRYKMNVETVKLSLASFEKLCHRSGVSPLNVFHAAWARLVSFATRSIDVCFGNVFSCRTIPFDGVENIVGPCFNSLPLRIKIPPMASNLDVMFSAQKANVEVLPYQLSSLRRIGKLVNHSVGNIFDSLLIFQQEKRNLDDAVWKLSSVDGVMEFPIICEVVASTEEDRILIQLHLDSCHAPQVDPSSLAKACCALIEHTINYPAGLAADQDIFFDSQKILADCSWVAEAQDIRNLSEDQEATEKDYLDLQIEQQTVKEALALLAGVLISDIKNDTTIFQLGLDSINAIQLSSILAKRGYNIYASDIMERQSVGQIATLLANTIDEILDVSSFDLTAFETRHRNFVLEQLGISWNSIEALRPCTPVQSGMLAQFIGSKGALYMNRIVLKSAGPLNKDLLKFAWSTVVARHEMLRTGFITLNDREFPFGMVTYQPHVTELPWNCDGVETSSENIASRLHVAPWSVVVRDVDAVTEMEFVALHAIYDAQSLDMILSDLLSTYKGQMVDERPSINPLLCDILSRSGAMDVNAQIFWNDHLKTANITKFPNLSPERCDELQFISEKKSCSIDIRTINKVCRESGVSIQAIGQAAWAKLISTYTGNTCVTFGIVLSGRNSTHGGYDIAFPSLVILPFPCRVEGSNREFITSIMSMNTQIQKVQFTPLTQVQRLIGVDEKPFDTLFVYQKLLNRKFDNRFWTVAKEEASGDFPVTIELIPSEEKLEMLLTHRNDVIPSHHAKILLEQLDEIFVDTLYRPDASAIDQTEISSHLFSVRPAKVPHIPTSINLLHEFVEYSAEIYPSKVSLEFASSITESRVEKRSWSYDQLNSEGQRVANLLLRLGASPADFVAICFDKCPEASFAILGVLKAGCAFVALDPSAPRARKQYIIDDSGAKLLICTSDKSSDLKALKGIHLVILDQPSDWPSISCQVPLLSRPVSPNDVCYCLYTSGTTGSPKGCQITHQNAVQAMLAFTRLFDGHWDAESRWLQFASFHFDVSILEQFWSWSVGICVSSCPRDVLFQDLRRAIELLQITHIDLTPSLAILLDPKDVPSLCKGIFITGGEQLKQEILDKWGKCEVIYNGYGPTEVTIGCTMLPRMNSRSKPSNIGPQFDNVGSYVLLPGTTRPVLQGGLGELCVSGVLVGRGYLNRPDLTKEKFQFVDEFRERIYRTGDLVRLLHDGSFQFLGRIDDQVKLRGQRLEVREINSVIQDSHENIASVATIVARHPLQAKEQLVSFITKNKLGFSKNAVQVIYDTKETQYLSPVRTALSRSLPGYMIPTHLIPMSHFPLSPNNKIEMKKLKSTYESLTLEDLRRLAAPTMDLSPVDQYALEKIINVIADFNNTTPDKIPPEGNLFQLGLDSISAISLAQSLRNAGFPSADTALLLRSSNIVSLAASLRNLSGTSLIGDLYQEGKLKTLAFTRKNSLNAAEHLHVSIDMIEKISPCTSLQEGMVTQFLSSQRPYYCSSFLFKLESRTSIDSLREAWLQTKREEEILRTRFVPLSIGCVQVLLKLEALPWSTTTVKNRDDIENTAQQRFNIWSSLLRDLSSQWWEVHLIQCRDETIMQLNIFHGLYDGISIIQLMERVASYSLGLKKPPSSKITYFDTLPLGPLRHVAGARDFWCQHLQTSPRGGVFQQRSSEDKAETIIVELIFSECLELREMRSMLKVTDQAILHASWLIVLQEHLAIPIILGILVSGRAIELHGAADVIGPLFNTIPSYIKVDDCRTYAELVQKCHEFYVSALPFQHTALRDVKKWTGRGPADPLFDILFTVQKEDLSHSSASKNTWTMIQSQSETGYPLALEVRIREQGEPILTIATSELHMTIARAKSLLESYQKTLLEIVKHPNAELPHLRECRERQIQDVNVQPINEYRDLNHIESQGELSYSWSIEARLIQEIIADLASVDREMIGPTTSIFELGLDSIDSIKLSSRLRQTGFMLTVSDIMKHRTIQKMDKCCADIRNFNKSPRAPMIDQRANELKAALNGLYRLPDDCESVLPATPLQEAMVAEMVASGYKHYWNTSLLELYPGVDPKKLLQAWRLTINKHPILRTSFQQVDSPTTRTTYAQIVHRGSSVSADALEIENKPMQEFIDQYQKKNVPSADSVPFRIVEVKNNAKSFLLLSIAHALYDGWSLDLLHEDVARFYSGEDVNRPSYEPLLTEILESSGEKASAFWSASLSGCKPTSFPSSNMTVGEGTLIHYQEMPLGTSGGDAAALCKRYDITLQALAVTTWALTLSERVRAPDVVFGVVFSGRNSPETQEMVFPTMNTVPFRAILHGSRLDMLTDVQDALADMTEHQHFPLRKLMKNGSANALFNTIFIFQSRPLSNKARARQLYKSVLDSSKTEFPLALEMERVEDQMVARIACRDNLLTESETLMLLGRLGEILHLIVSKPTHATLRYAASKISICGGAFFPVVEREDEQPQTTTTPRSHSGSWSETGLAIREVLSAVSQVPEHEITDDMTIFHLGLDSISSIKVSSLLKKRSINISVETILKAGTIFNMVGFINNQTDISHYQKGKNKPTRVLDDQSIDKLLQRNDIKADQIERILPASSGQEYFLASYMLNSELFYPGFFYSAARLDKSDLEKGWKILVESLSILRTAFLSTGKRTCPTVQIIFKVSDHSVTWHENYDPDAWAKDTRTAMLSSSSIIRPVALHAMTTNTKTYIMLKIHHALYDAVSLPRMVTALATLSSGGAVMFPSIDLPAFITFQQEHSSLAEQKEFWQTYLGQRPPNQKANTPEAEYCPFQQYYKPGLVTEISKAKTVAKENGLSIQSLFLAIYARIYTRIILADGHNHPKEGNIPKPNTIVLGVYSANRGYDMEELVDMMAPALSILPLKIKLEGTIVDIAHRVQADLQKISRIEYCGVSLTEIADWTGVYVDAYVNLLRVPDNSNIEGSANSDKRDAIEFTYIDPQLAKKHNSIDHDEQNVVSDSGRAVSVPDITSRWKKGIECVADVYSRALVDVEVAIRNDCLDVGIFSISQLLNPGLAEKMMEEIKWHVVELMKR